MFQAYKEGTDLSSAQSSAGSEISSDGLETELRSLEISSRRRDDETFLSPDTGSLVSTTSEEGSASKLDSRKNIWCPKT